MELYLKKAREMIKKLDAIEIEHISRIENDQVDILARMATISDTKTTMLILVEVKDP